MLHNKGIQHIARERSLPGPHQRTFANVLPPRRKKQKQPPSSGRHLKSNIPQ